MPSRTTRKKSKGKSPIYGGQTPTPLESFVSYTIQTGLKYLNENDEEQTRSLFYNLLKAQDCYKPLIQKITERIIDSNIVTDKVESLNDYFTIDGIIDLVGTVFKEAGIYNESTVRIILQKDGKLVDRVAKIVKSTEMNNIKAMLSIPNIKDSVPNIKEPLRNELNKLHQFIPENIDDLTEYYSEQRLSPLPSSPISRSS